jgi:hypothetical protein
VETNQRFDPPSHLLTGQPAKRLPPEVCWTAPQMAAVPGLEEVMRPAALGAIKRVRAAASWPTQRCAAAVFVLPALPAMPVAAGWIPVAWDFGRVLCPVTSPATGLAPTSFPRSNPACPPP